MSTNAADLTPATSAFVISIPVSLQSIATWANNFDGQQLCTARNAAMTGK
ncbi:MAG: hypothetical protein JNM43_23515 [Planctomycetaceae bacterium]|nr:hypothetical protein [Planctomycetaceae bacterium]